MKKEERGEKREESKRKIPGLGQRSYFIFKGVFQFQGGLTGINRIAGAMGDIL